MSDDENENKDPNGAWRAELMKKDLDDLKELMAPVDLLSYIPDLRFQRRYDPNGVECLVTGMMLESDETFRARIKTELDEGTK